MAADEPSSDRASPQGSSAQLVPAASSRDLDAANGNLRGRWVALRDGRVVASADSLDLLGQDERVQPGDVLCGTYSF
jgi:hypothetical protein